jgi:formylglycine-generating enzyme required for sulfatase activity
MAGNVAEWVDDIYSLDDEGFGYPDGAGDAEEVDPRGDGVTLAKKGRSTAGPHVVRGGSYLEGVPWMRAASRGVPNSSRSASIGFRCAADR